MSKAPKRTKIICTIGPATDSVLTMVQLGIAGMDVARLNFSHGTHDAHSVLMKRLRQAGKRLERPFALLQDLQGPKIRVGDLPKDGVELKGSVTFTTDPHPRSGDISVTLPELHRDIKAGAQILLDDGLLECKVRKIEGRRIHCQVIHGGILKSHKGLNLPGTSLKIPALSDKDRSDALFGIQSGVDYIAMSFVRTAKDVADLRKIIAKKPAGKKIQIVGKIEKPEAVDNFDAILPLLDVVMVARGDLGIETQAARVPIIQKQLIDACRHAGKPVIVATQMLDSMQRSPRATRAETSDVANAVSDHADAVMLSGETATGSYPLEAVKTMSEIIRTMEASQFDNLTPYEVPANQHIPGLIGATARVVSDALQHAPIVMVTTSGHTARDVSSFRPEARLFAVTHDETVYRQLRAVWGIEPFLTKRLADPNAAVRAGLGVLKKGKHLKAGEFAVVVSGPAPGKPGSTNKLEVIRI